MARIIDNLLAYRILSLLVVPFNKSDAFKLGIIDADGKILKRMKDLTTEEEKNSYSYLHRLVFNMKKLLNKLPGGDKYTKNIIAAYFLIKESYASNNSTNMESRLNTLLESNCDFSLDESIVIQFLEDLPTSNTTGIEFASKPLSKTLKRKLNPKEILNLKSFKESLELIA